VKRVILAAILGSALLVPGLVSAADYEDSNVKVFINNQQLSFNQNPVVSGGRILVPLRGIFEPLGASVQWDNDTRTIAATKGNKAVSLTIGSNVAYLNGVKINLDAPPDIVNGSTMVPIRFVSESLETSVGYDAIQNQITLTPSSAVNNTDQNNTAPSTNHSVTTGTFKYSDGQYYQGELQNGKSNGKGKVYSSDGRLELEGTFVDGALTGNGTAYDTTGKVLYEGQFKEWKFDSTGKYYANGYCFDAHWKDGKLDTWNPLTITDWRNNMIYKGTWNNGFNGNGTYWGYNINSMTSRVDGEFINNTLKHGTITYYAGSLNSLGTINVDNWIDKERYQDYSNISWLPFSLYQFPPQ
jgi:hypothetical protein